MNHDKDLQLSHIDKETNQPAMVYVGDKQPTRRRATAQSTVSLGPRIMALLTDGDIHTKKGPVFHSAVIAGTMAVKRTADLIPLCHPMPVEGIEIDISAAGDNVVITCSVNVFAKTGVEMEALMGASVAALTIYDMCKALSHNIVIKETKLIEKTGGKSDYKADR